MIRSVPTRGIAPVARSGRAPRTAGRLILVAASILALSATATTAQSPSPAASEPVAAASPAPFPATVAGPGTEPLGVPYAEWATRWWDWLLSFPAAQDPSLATTCPASPSGEVVFLPQTYFGTIEQLTCEIPAGTPILVAAGGSLCVVGDGDTIDDLPGCVKESDDSIFNPSIAVDGRLVPGIEDHHAGQPFTLTLVKDNPLGMPEGSIDACASGWMAMLSDLSPGAHTIVARDETEDPVLGRQVAEMIATITVTED